MKWSGAGIVLACTALLVSGLGAEVGLRVIDPAPSSNVVPDEVLGCSRKPNAHFTHAGGDGGGAISFSTDVSGLILRSGGDPFRSGATLRVMMLGDSVLAGLGVPTERNVSYLVQRNLEARLPKDVAVLNLGASGYEPLRYLLSFRIWRQRFPVRRLARRSRLVTGSYQVLRDAGGWALAAYDGASGAPPCPSSNLRVQQFWRREGDSVLFNPFAIFKRDLTREDQAVVEDIVNHLRILRDEAEDSGSRFVLVIVPHAFQVTGQSPTARAFFCVPDGFVLNDRPQRLVGGFCRERRTACLDLLPGWRESDVPLSFAGDPHLDERGHTAVARVLTDLIMRTLGAD